MILKFRAWMLDHKKFIYLDLADPDEELFGRHGILQNEAVDQWLPFIGLHDRNGKEIYVGDFCQYKDDSGTARIGIVRDRGYLSFYIHAVGGDEEGNQDGELHPDCQKDINVIGNFFEKLNNAIK